MKSPISLTNKAIQKIKQLTINSNKFALRLDLKKGGCAGMEYFMEYVDKVEQNEEVIDFDGAKVIIAPLAQMYLFGTTIDYEDGILESGSRVAIYCRKLWVYLCLGCLLYTSDAADE